MTRWTADDIPDLQGKLAVVTGANSGLGLETTRALVGHGAKVVMACRSQAKADAAMAELKEDLGEAIAERLEFRALDLASLESVRSFAADLLAAHPRLDLLINNAGVMALPRRETADGFEMQFGTNHLGHFALTGLMIGALLATPGSRVVTVSSLAHRMGKIRFDDLQRTRRYEKWTAYGQSKLANLLFCFELQRRLDAAGAETISVAAHPGYSSTNLQLAGPRMRSASLAEKVMNVGNKVIAQDAAMGALPSLRAATGVDVLGGDFFGPGGFMEVTGYPVKVQASARAYDREVGARLWEVSRELTGVAFSGL
ncbi:SDR family oxidoreductase [Pseudenhygromyxa sp. WMMC2535]|uniref:oxidoreductase n=1 Tax=Pseudenhygromyxa sp. WMMC2535 TaxID=2712867 RepID=UPI00155169DB|nr:SDR family oxidoreductase [Pseudenhygromyxa sp. WMMC2535]